MRNLFALLIFLSCFCVSSFTGFQTLAFISCSSELDIENTLHVVHLFIEFRGLFKRAVRLQSTLTLWVFELYGEVVTNLVNQDHCLFVEPLHALSVLPQPVLYLAFSVVDVGSKAMLFALVPPSFVLTAISPVVDAKAFFFVH